MALTRITQGVIKPNENYDTHNINSTGIVTATGLNISGNASIGGVLTYEDVTNIDSIGIITARSGVDVDDFLSVGSNIHLGNAGVVTATSFSGDGSALTGLASDKIFEGNTKAEVSDSGTDGKFFVETEGTERFSIDSTGDFAFNNCNDSFFNAGGNLTIDYKTSNSIRLRQQITSSAANMILYNVPFTIWNNNDAATTIDFHRGDRIQVGSGVSIGVSGNIFATGIVTASNFVKADGTGLGGLTAESSDPYNTHSNNGAGALTSNSKYNTIVGWNAGNNISTGDQNTIYGYRAGGVHNNSQETIIGANCFSERSGHTKAVGLGYGAGKWNQGDNNTAIGYESVGANGTSSGDNNTGVGYNALRNITDGSNNVALGYSADNQHTTGSNCIVIGANADASAVDVSNEITLGDSNINHLRVPGIGVSFSTNGNHISGVTTFTGEIHGDGQRLGGLSGGRFSGLFLNNGASYYGSNKLFVADGNGFGLDAYGGNDAWLKANSGGGSSGDCWMRTGSSGGYVIAKGAGAVELHHAGTSDKKLETVSGGVNVVGSLTVNGAALESGIAGIDTTGTSHFNHLSVSGIATFSGTEAIFNRVSFPQSGNKTIVGNMAGGSGPQGSEITVVGYGAGYNSSGDRLTAIGRMAGRSATGTDNVCIGYEAGYSNEGAQKNVFVGKDSGAGNKTGSNNIVVGSDAGEGVWNNANYTNSVILGAEAGATLTSSNSNVIVIGYDAEPSSASVTNEITLGNSSITNLRVPGIGVTFATSGNHISGITTFSSHVQIPDAVAGNDYASLYLGDGNDVRFFHNGQHTFLQHKLGTPSNGGEFLIDSYSTLKLRSSDGSSGVENAIIMNGNGSVELYHSGTKKLETTSTGINVTGKVVASDEIESTVNIKSPVFSIAGTAPRLDFTDTDNNPDFSIYGSGGQFRVRDQTNSQDRLTINSSGLVSISGDLDVDGHTNLDNVSVSGVVTATSFHGDGSNLTGISGGGGGVTSDSEENTVGGTDAGAALDSDTYRNTLFGFDTGKTINSGDDNTIMGWKAGDAIDSGYKNCAVGSEALPNCNSGHNNVAMGWEAGRSLNSGNNNVMLGPMAGRSIGGGTYNIALGYHALSNVSSPTRCIGIGGDSIFLGGTDVIGIGQGTMMKGGSQIGGIGIGRYAGRNNGGDHNVYIGYEAGHGYGSGSPYSIGNYNIGFGYQSLYDIKNGYDNVAIGASAGSNINDGHDNVLIGVRAGLAQTTTQGSVYIGRDAGYNTKVGNQVAIGKEALMYSGATFSTSDYRGSQHTAIGNQCMKNLGVYVNYNTAVGEGAMRSATAGFNAAFGQNALASGSGEINTAIGMNSLDVCNGSWNSALGYKSGDDCTSGSKNSLIGVYAGEDINGGSHNLCLGAYSTVSASGVSNEAVIGAPLGHASVINHVRMPGIGVSFSTGGNHITGITTFKDRIKLGNSGNGELYYSGGIKMVSTAQIELESANQMYLKAQSSGLFLFASNQEVVSVYGGAGGGVYFKHNNTQKLKLEGGNWTYQNSPTVTFDGNILASSDSAIDIGTNTVRFANIYADTLYGDGSNLTGISGGGGGVTSDAQENTVGGTGAGANFSGTSARDNTLFGHNTGNDITSGDYNTCYGSSAGELLQTGHSNTCIGSDALRKGVNTTVHSNVMIGRDAGKEGTSTNKNVVIGNEALKESTSSQECVFIGYGAGNSILSGINNVAVGQNAGAGAYNQSGGDQNTSIGHESGKRYTTGSNNSLLGVFSGDNITSGSDNVCIGANAGDTGTNNLTTGSNNILIGHDAQATSSSVSNEITIGDTNITTFRIPGLSASISATESVLPAANFNAGVLQEAYHNDTGGGMTSNYNHDVLTYGMVWNGVTNAAGSFTFNVRGDGSTTFDSLTTTNRVTTMTIYSANNSTSNYMTAFKIDGTTQTVKWAGGSAPSAATGSGVDVYSMTIMKTAANTYHVFGNVTNFA